MSGQPQKPKPASRWGSLLSGAVAGLESRLDTILADDEQASAKSRAAEETARQAKASQLAAAKVDEVTRASSRNRTNNRLQERLAKAINKGPDGQRADSVASSDGPSEVASPALVAEGRASVDSKVSDITQDVTGVDSASQVPVDERVSEAVAPPPKSSLEVAERPQIPEIAFSAKESSPRQSYDSGASRPSLDVVSENLAGRDQSPRVSTERDMESVLFELSQLRQEQAERKEEIHAHLERIDALQAKLQYLAKAAAESAHKAAAEEASGSVDKKLAEKEEQIALLMEEGQKLAKKELALSNAIKNLRIKSSEEVKRAAEAKQKLAKTEQTLQDLSERTRRAEAAEKQAQIKLKTLSKIEKDVDALVVEREAAASTIAELRRQLAEADKRAEEAEKRVQSGALEVEKKAVKELTEELENSKIEKKLAEGRAKAQLRDAKDEASRNEEKARALEIELRGEIANLETKLEVLRTRSEDLTSSTTSDSQAKLLRQIETLQTQYALAHENWETLESSLTSRLTAVEKERDDIAKREGDIRRKAREVNTKSRRLEDELEEVNERTKALETELETQRSQATKLQTTVSQTERKLEDAQADFDREKKVWEADLLQRIEDERNKWRLEAAQQPLESPYLRAESPTAPFFRKQSQADFLGSIYNSRRGNMRAGSSELQPITTDSRPTSSRRTSKTPTESLSRNLTTTSLSQLNGLTPTSASQAPSMYTGEPDETPISASSPLSSSPHRTIADVISASNASAGPSVQLVSSMSAAVRRLEAEKAASKEELTRIIAQRDEAREEVVGLMREVEEKRALGLKVDKLEKDLAEVQKRYEASLELLGEKQEEVEELKNDVLDLKQMLRELAESKAVK